MIKRNNPKLIIVKGKEINSINGLTILFNKANTTATKNAILKLAT